MDSDDHILIYRPGYGMLANINRLGYIDPRNKIITIASMRIRRIIDEIRHLLTSKLRLQQ